MIKNPDRTIYTRYIRTPSGSMTYRKNSLPKRVAGQLLFCAFIKGVEKEFNLLVSNACLGECNCALACPIAHHFHLHIWQFKSVVVGSYIAV